MTQTYKITCEVTVSVGDIPMSKNLSEQFFTRMLQEMFKGQQLKILDVARIDAK